MTTHRTERVLLGEREILVNALDGIHTFRSLENFPLARRTIQKGNHGDQHPRNFGTD